MENKELCSTKAIREDVVQQAFLEKCIHITLVSEIDTVVLMYNRSKIQK